MSLTSVWPFSDSDSQNLNEYYSQSFYKPVAMGKCILCIYIEPRTQEYQSNLKAQFVMNYTIKICLRLKTKQKILTTLYLVFSSLQSIFSYIISLNFHNFGVELGLLSPS